MTASEAVHAVHQRAIGWALNRSLASTSVSGISLVLGLCAAAWFSAGTRPDNIKAVVALCGCYLAACAAGQLPVWPGSGVARVTAGRLAAASSVLGESAVLAGLALGGAAAGWGDPWPVAVAVLILVWVRETMRACSGGQGGLVRRPVWRLLAVPAAGRVLVIAITAPVWGAHVTLLALFGWSVIAVGYAIFEGAPGLFEGPAALLEAGTDSFGGATDPFAGATDPREDQAVVVRMPDPAAGAPMAEPAEPVAAPTELVATPTELVAAPTELVAAPAELVAVPADQPTDLAVLLDRDATRVPALSSWAAAGRAAASQRAGRSAGPAGGVILACRDDGPVARWLGRLVRGNLMPLPPAVAGVAAASVLALLGLRDLPAVIMLTPLVVMVLLAAPGSSHPHDGRQDWLVPAVLQAGQYIYIAALGFASGVPAPVTFALCLAVAAWYADLASCGVGSGLGWEGRMLVVGLGAVVGLETFAYLGLTAYLGVLIGKRFRPSWVAVVEGERR